MNAKSPRSRSRNSGVTRMPSRPHTTRSPARDLAQLAAGRPAAVDRPPPRPCAGARPRPTRRERARGCAGWWSNRSRRGRCRRGRRSAAARRFRATGLQPSCIRSSTRRRRPAALGADTFSEMRENSSLVRPIAKSSTSKAPPRSMTLSKIALRMFESIRWPSAPTTAECGVSVLHDEMMASLCRVFTGLPSSSMAQDPHKPLRDDVRLLGELLGETLRRDEGVRALRAGRAGARARQAHADRHRRRRLRGAGRRAARDAGRGRAAGGAQLRAFPQPRQRRRTAPPDAAAARAGARAGRPAAAGLDRRGAAAPARGGRIAGRALRRGLSGCASSW